MQQNHLNQRRDKVELLESLVNQTILDLNGPTSPLIADCFYLER